MKKLLLLSSIIFFLSCNETKEKPTIAEISCGQCQFGLTSQKGCDLAVRINGNAYFVDGAHIDDFGDAHDKTTGFCEVIRKGEVKGNVVDGRFKVSTIVLTGK
jgi:hypothetical protein